ncbi:MAG: hypothetical protein LBP21_09730 [Synergistaceae bacterium]|jgi:hypothetical protein|nr:hypothetical protein [Synergistaceae bacterium]
MAVFEADVDDLIRDYELEDDKGFLFCLYEAVSNALYCCLGKKRISIEVRLSREYRANELANDEDHYIRSFSITDNGVGFTDDNYAKFTKTIFKTNHEGGKGRGRLAFLKVFEEVKIESSFEEGGEVFKRSFSFNKKTHTKTARKIPMPNGTPAGTTLTFFNIKKRYETYTKKTLDYFSNEVLRHFYIFFYYLLEEKKEFEIKIIDDNGMTEGIINTAKLRQDETKKDTFTLTDANRLPGMNTASFELVHIKSTNLSENNAFYVVDERSAGEIRNLDLPPGKLEDENGKAFFYYAYLKSEYFGQFLNESRTKLSLPKKSERTSFVTEALLEQEISRRIDDFLQYEIAVLDTKKEQKIKDTLSDANNNITAHNKAYLYILGDSDTKKTLLEKIKYSDGPQNILKQVKEFHEELQSKTVEHINHTLAMLQEGNANIDFAELDAEIRGLIEKVNGQNLVNLSSYIMYRKYVLNLFDKGLKKYRASEIQNETFFHNLLLPKRTDNNIDSNLWLLDDLFLYFEGTSEMAIEDITIGGKKIIRALSAEERRQVDEFNQKRLRLRIDLLFFPDEKKCVIIELKDPKEKVSENVHQMDRYAQLIANFVKPEYSLEHFYTFLVTDNFNKYDQPGNGYRKIYGIDGFVRPAADIKSYENDLIIANQYSEVIRYTDIYERARKRNEVFFEKLNN